MYKLHAIFCVLHFIFPNLKSIILYEMREKRQKKTALCPAKTPIRKVILNLPREIVVWITDCRYMTSTVYCGSKINKELGPLAQLVAVRFWIQAIRLCKYPGCSELGTQFMFVLSFFLSI